MNVYPKMVHLRFVCWSIAKQTPANRFETFSKTVNHKHTFGGIQPAVVSSKTAFRLKLKRTHANQKRRSFHFWSIRATKSDAPQKPIEKWPLYITVRRTRRERKASEKRAKSELKLLSAARTACAQVVQASWSKGSDAGNIRTSNLDWQRYGARSMCPERRRALRMFKTCMSYSVWVIAFVY